MKHFHVHFKCRRKNETCGWSERRHDITAESSSESAIIYALYRYGSVPSDFDIIILGVEQF